MSVNLEEDIGYVLFTLDDGSKILIRTTFNEDILGPALRSRVPDHIFDLDRRRWMKIPDEGKLEILKTRPVLGEVDEFVNRHL